MNSQRLWWNDSFSDEFFITMEEPDRVVSFLVFECNSYAIPSTPSVIPSLLIGSPFMSTSFKITSTLLSPSLLSESSSSSSLEVGFVP